MNITLLGTPKSTNHIYKYACRGSFLSMYMTADGRTLKEDYQWQARSQFHGEPLSGRLEIDVTLYFDRKGRKDWDTPLDQKDTRQLLEHRVRGDRRRGQVKENPHALRQQDGPYDAP